MWSWDDLDVPFSNVRRFKIIILYYIRSISCCSGMEALEMSITYWEDAMSAYTRNTNSDSLAVTNEEESELCGQLQKLLDVAYKLQDECELLFLDQVWLVWYLRKDRRHGGWKLWSDGQRSNYDPLLMRKIVETCAISFNFPTNRAFLEISIIPAVWFHKIRLRVWWLPKRIFSGGIVRFCTRWRVSFYSVWIE